MTASLHTGLTIQQATNQRLWMKGFHRILSRMMFAFVIMALSLLKAYSKPQIAFVRDRDDPEGVHVAIAVQY